LIGVVRDRLAPFSLLPSLQKRKAKRSRAELLLIT
jgi:hypothetical protein